MTTLSHYNDDGANFQAKGVLAFLQSASIESSWNKEYHRYDAEIKVSRWENCREQGYVVFLVCNHKQLNIAFFEHRNLDSIHAVKWEQITLNSPTINTANFGDIYKDKYDTSFSVPYGEVVIMANWIEEQLTEFWETNIKLDNE